MMMMMMMQVKLFKLFPYKYWATMFTCIIASVQGAVVGLCIDTNKASWALGWNLQLLTIIYSVRTRNFLLELLYGNLNLFDEMITSNNEISKARNTI